MSAPKKLTPEERRAVALDLALKLRRGQITSKDVPAELRPHVEAVPEKAILARAVETSRVKHYGQHVRTPAVRTC